MATASVGVDESDTQLLQTRLAAGAGSRLARHLNEILESGKASVAQGAPLGDAKVAIEQAVASIKQTSRERFGMAQAMLKKALADDPNNIDIAVALAALQLRGIQMVWFSPEEAIAAEAQAKATLERDYLSALLRIRTTGTDNYGNPNRLTLTLDNGEVLDFARRGGAPGIAPQPQ